jgi:serine protease
MRHPLSALAALCLALAPIALQMPHAAATTGATAATQETARVIVQYKAGSSVMRALSARTELPANQRIPRHAAVLSTRHGVAMTDGAAVSARSQVVFAKGMSSAKLAELLSKDADVEFAEPDRKRRILAVSPPNDPLYPVQTGPATPAVGQWYLRAPDSTNLAGINATGAWNTTMGTSTVVVAVLDTGVRFEHPDLRGKLLPGYDMIADHGDGLAHANDGNGRDADASDPGDWVTETEANDPSGPFYQCTTTDSSGRYQAENSSWHGTQVAGIIAAATNNSLGIASVGRNVMVLPVRVLGKCEGYDSDIQAGMQWAAGISVPGVPDNTTPAKVINMSLGGGTGCTGVYQTVVDQIVSRGVTIVASAGNEGLAVAAPGGCSGVIAVAGVRHVGTKVGYSSLGPEVALSAPAGNCVNDTGACLYPLATTTNTGTTTPRFNSYSDSFDTSLGTSFSSPLVAGTAALMLSVNPALTPALIRSELRSSARAFPTTSPTAGVTQCHAPNSTPQDTECICTTSTCGAGLLDASAAVAAAVAARATPAPTVPFQSTADEVMPGGTIALDASGTQAPSGRTIANYAWAISGTGASLSGTLNGPSASSINLSATAPGVVTVTLTVTDSIGSTSTASKIFTIASGPTAIFFASASSTTAGTAVSLDATASTAAGGRSIASYQWSIVSGSASATLSSTSGSSVTVTPNAAGTVTVQLTVTDSGGATGSTTSAITVSGGSSGGGGGGGGGALGLGWLLALVAAVLGVAGTRRSTAP